MRQGVRVFNVSWQVLIILLSILCCGLYGQDAIPPAEREALIALFQSTNGEQWVNSENWLGPEGTEGTWLGVTVEEGHVRAISLWNLNLVGTIPPEIGDLTELHTLDLNGFPCFECSPPGPGNRIMEPLPAQLFQLQNLTTLILEGNEIGGELPAEIGNLASLVELRLRGNGFTGSVPQQWLKLSQIELLDLGGNELSGPVPGFLSGLPVRVLVLSGNQFEGPIPVEFGLSSNLHTLSLVANRLRGSIPPELAAVELLFLSRNALSGSVPTALLEGLSAEEFITGLEYNALDIDPPDRERFAELAEKIEQTQTMPPRQLRAEQVNGRLAVRLRWSPIAFLDDPGGYLISAAPSAEGPFVQVAATDSKGASSALVDGLAGGQEHFFRLQARSDPSPFNRNTLLSSMSAAASAVVSDPPPPARLYLPSALASGDGEMGIALTNYSAEPAEAQIAAFDTDGLLLALPRNPVEIELPAGTQFARLASEIFAGAVPDSGWAEVRSANPDLAGLFLLGNASRLDGTSALIEQHRRLVFTEILELGSGLGESSPGTTLQIANPNQEAVKVELRLRREPQRNPLGPPDLAVTLDIPAQGFVSRTVSQMFAQQISGPPGLVEAEVLNGPGAVGFQLLELAPGQNLAGLAAATEVFDSASYAAQVVCGGGFSTRVTLAKIDPDHPGQAFARVSLYGNQGRIIRPMGIVAFTSMSVLFEVAQSADPCSFFRLDGEQPTAATLVVEADTPQVVGSVLIHQTEDSRSALAFPLRQRLIQEAVFSQILSSPEAFTGLAFFNPGPEEALITLQAFSPQGTLVGEREFELQPLGRLSQLLRELLDEPERIGGFLRLSSTAPIAVEQVLGDLGGESLAAVPPTVIR